MISTQSSKQSQKTVSTPQKEMMWTPQQQQMSSVLGNTIQQGLNSPIPSYPNQLYVSRTPEEQAYMQFVPGDQMTYLQNAMAGRPSTEINPEASAAYANAQEAAGLRNWQTRILPGINEQYVGPGYYGTARGNAIANAGADLAANLATMRTGLNYQDEIARRALAESAANRVLPAVMQQSMSLSNVGSLARSIEEQKMQSDFMRWMMGETINGVTPWQNNPYLQSAFSYLNYFPYQLGQQMTSTGSGSSSGFGVTSPFSWQFGK